MLGKKFLPNVSLMNSAILLVLLASFACTSVNPPCFPTQITSPKGGASESNAVSITKDDFKITYSKPDCRMVVQIYQDRTPEPKFEMKNVKSDSVIPLSDLVATSVLHEGTIEVKIWVDDLTIESHHIWLFIEP